MSKEIFDKKTTIKGLEEKIVSLMAKHEAAQSELQAQHVE